MDTKRFITVILGLLLFSSIIAIATTPTWRHSVFEIYDGSLGKTTGWLVDGEGCEASYCVYQTWYNSSLIVAKNGSSGAIDYSGTDATTILNSVLTTDKTVHLRSGTYGLSSNISIVGNNISLICENKFNTVLKINNAVEKDVISIGNDLNSANGISIKDCTIDGNEAGQATAWTDPVNGLRGIWISTFYRNITIENNIIKNTNSWNIGAKGRIYPNILSNTNLKIVNNNLGANNSSIMWIADIDKAEVYGNTINMVGDDGDAFDIYNTVNISIHDNVILSSTGTCLGVYDNSKVSFKDNLCYDIESRGIYAGYFNSNDNGTEIMASGNEIRMILGHPGYQYGIDLNGVVNSSITNNKLYYGEIYIPNLNSSKNNIIENNMVFDSPATCVYSTSALTIIKNNYCLNAATNGIYIAGGYNQVSGNEIVGASASSDDTNSGILLAGTDSYITDNFFRKPAGANDSKYNINETGSANNNIIENNKIENAGQTGTINKIGAGSVSVQNYGSPGFNHGVTTNTSNVSAFGANDIVTNSSNLIPNTCQSSAAGTTNWEWAHNGTAGC